MSQDRIGRLVHWMAKRRAIRRFLTILPRRLFEEFGRAPYTPEQVEATIRRFNLSAPRHWPYALAIFCDPVQLARLRQERGGLEDYRRMRDEVGAGSFGGNGDFSANDVARNAGETGGHFGSGGHSDHGGGHDGGGGHH